MLTNTVLLVLGLWLLTELVTYVAGARRYGWAWPVNHARRAWQMLRARRSPPEVHSEACGCDEETY